MDKQYLIRVEENKRHQLNQLNSTEQVLVEVHGRPPSREDPVILATDPQHHETNGKRFIVYNLHNNASC